MMRFPFSADNLALPFLCLVKTLPRRLVRRFAKFPHATRFARGASWSLLGTLASRLLSLASSVLVARSLGTESFGQLGILQSTVGMFALFAGFGMGITCTKHVAGLRRSDPARAGRLIALSSSVAGLAGLLATLLLFLAAQPVAAHALAAPQLASCLRLCSPILLFASLNGAHLGSLTGLEAFKTVTFLNIISALVSSALLMAGACLYHLHGAAAALLLGQIITCLISAAALRRQAAVTAIPISHRHALRESPVLWQFTLPNLLSTLLIIPVNWLCSTVLVNQPGGYIQMGLFAVANQWRALAMLLPNTVLASSFPILVDALENADAPEAHRFSHFTVHLNFGLVAAAAFLLAFAAPFILSAYGPQFQTGANLLCLCAISAIPAVYNTSAIQLLLSRDKAWLAAAITATWSIALYGVSLILIPRYMAVGLATAQFAVLILESVTFHLALKPQSSSSQTRPPPP